MAGASTERKIMRCGIYTRKSTTNGLDQDFNSLDAQKAACEHFIRSQSHASWVVYASFEDGGYSGSNTERPGFQSLMGAIAEGQIDVVVVYKVDRLSRSLLDFAKIMDILNQCGVAFVSVTQNFSTADAIGRLTLNMLMSFAEFEREMISERTRDKIAGARKRGHWTGGGLPFGYQNIGRKLVPDPIEAPITKEIFQLYLDHGSAQKVAKILNQMQAPCRTRGKNQDAGAWCKVTVLRILQNPLYTGKMPYRDELFDGEHEALVEQTLFDQVQALLEVNGRGKEIRHDNDAYLLKGVLRCGCCGSAMTSASTRRNQKTYRYYRCVSQDKYRHRACPSKPLPAEQIEQYVISQLQHVVAQEHVLPGVIEKAQIKIVEKRVQLLKLKAQLPPTLARLSNTLRGLTKHGQSANVAQISHDVAGKLAAAEQQMAQVERELAALEGVERNLGWSKQMMENFETCWQAMTPLNRLRLIKALVQEVVVNEQASQVMVKLFHLSALTEVNDDTIELDLLSDQTEQGEEMYG